MTAERTKERAGHPLALPPNDGPAGREKGRWSATGLRRIDARFRRYKPPKGRAMREPMDETWRTELLSRESNGITVRLLWSRATNVVTVAVADAASDDYIELVLGEPEPELAVFKHPFA